MRLFSDQIDDIAYTRQGYLLFVSVGTNPGLWGVPFGGGAFDRSKATLIEAGATNFAIGNDGTLLYQLPATQRSSLVWVDRSRTIIRAAGEPVEGVTDVELSPDGNHAAYVTRTLRGSTVVVRDLKTGVDRPLTLNKLDDAGADRSERPAWFPQGDRLLYVTGQVSATQIVAQRMDAAAEGRVLTSGISARVTPDGRTLLFAIDDHGSQRLRRATMTGDGTPGPAAPVLNTDGDPNVLDFDVSQDGTLLAYAATQSDGRASVFVTDLPDAAARWLVSQAGRHPRFSHDGHELFYTEGRQDADGHPIGEVMSVPFTTHPVALGRPTRLFDSTEASALYLGNLAVTSDGRRFLMWQPLPPAPGEGQRLVLLQNWPALLER